MVDCASGSKYPNEAFALQLIMLRDCGIQMILRNSVSGNLTLASIFLVWV